MYELFKDSCFPLQITSTLFLAISLDQIIGGNNRIPGRPIGQLKSTNAEKTTSYRLTTGNLYSYTNLQHDLTNEGDINFESTSRLFEIL